LGLKRRKDLNKKLISACAVGILAMTLAATVVVSIGRSMGSSSLDSNHKILRMAHALDINHPVHKALEYMNERLKVISGGQMELQIYPSSQLGSETELLEMIQNSELDMMKTSTAALEGFIPAMSVFGIPYLFKNDAHQWQVLDGKIGQELLDIGSDKGFVGLAYYDSGSRNFYSISQHVFAKAIRIIRVKLDIGPKWFAGDGTSLRAKKIIYCVSLRAQNINILSNKISRETFELFKSQFQIRRRFFPNSCFKKTIPEAQAKSKINAPGVVWKSLSGVVPKVHRWMIKHSTKGAIAPV
jgi:hypothetical protein